MSSQADVNVNNTYLLLGYAHCYRYSRLISKFNHRSSSHLHRAAPCSHRALVQSYYIGIYSQSDIRIYLLPPPRGWISDDMMWSRTVDRHINGQLIAGADHSTTWDSIKEWMLTLLVHQRAPQRPGRPGHPDSLITYYLGRTTACGARDREQGDD